MSESRRALGHCRVLEELFPDRDSSILATGSQLRMRTSARRVRLSSRSTYARSARRLLISDTLLRQEAQLRPVTQTLMP